MQETGVKAHKRHISPRHADETWQAMKNAKFTSADTDVSRVQLCTLYHYARALRGG